VALDHKSSPSYASREPCEQSTNLRTGDHTRSPRLHELYTHHKPRTELIPGPRAPTNLSILPPTPALPYPPQNTNREPPAEIPTPLSSSPPRQAGFAKIKIKNNGKNTKMNSFSRARASEHGSRSAPTPRLPAQSSHENKTTTQRVNGGSRHQIPPADTKIRTARDDADRITRVRARGGRSGPQADARREVGREREREREREDTNRGEPGAELLPHLLRRLRLDGRYRSLLSHTHNFFPLFFGRLGPLFLFWRRPASTIKLKSHLKDGIESSRLFDPKTETRS